MLSFDHLKYLFQYLQFEVQLISFCKIVYHSTISNGSNFPLLSVNSLRSAFVCINTLIFEQLQYPSAFKSFDCNQTKLWNNLAFESRYLDYNFFFYCYVFFPWNTQANNFFLRLLSTLSPIYFIFNLMGGVCDIVVFLRFQRKRNSTVRHFVCKLVQCTAQFPISF